MAKRTNHVTKNTPNRQYASTSPIRMDGRKIKIKSNTCSHDPRAGYSSQKKKTTALRSPIGIIKVFGGAGWLLLYKERWFNSEVYNDINEEITEISPQDLLTNIPPLRLISLKITQ
ncbi:MAG: hypothetical protein ACRCV0_06500 [Brevinema sp.]